MELAPLRNRLRHDNLTRRLKELEIRETKRLEKLTDPDDPRVNSHRWNIAALKFAIEVIDTTAISDLEDAAHTVGQAWGFAEKENK